MKLPAIFDRYRQDVDAELRSALPNGDLPLHEAMRYHLGWIDQAGKPISGGGGKALRPCLCLLACEALRGDHHPALPAAGAVELVHNFSLIHDDIQDGDKERRHRPTVWWLWGKPKAIAAGTAMRSVAGIALSRLDNEAVPVERQLRAAQALDRSCLEMIEGQYLDLSYEGRLDIGVAGYLDMISRKTGALMGCSLEMGAIVGTADGAPAKRFGSFGRKLGLAFQIRDDVLSVWGDEKQTGKPFANDIKRKKNSFPIVFAIEKERGQKQSQLQALYQRQSMDEDTVAAVLARLEEMGAEEQAQTTAREFLKAALAELGGLRLAPEARRDLEETATFLVERDY